MFYVPHKTNELDDAREDKNNQIGYLFLLPAQS
jgi:hypothetical protein